jgi:hypothetical protein
MTEIQSRLKAPKGQENKFGGYRYRSAEDIVEAVKPILLDYDAHLKITDEIVLIGDRFYVKATATIKIADVVLEEATAFAREAEHKKGMDDAQVTGAASSYARKYALNGLLGIDDTKDADTMDNREQGKMTGKPVDSDKVDRAVSFFKDKIDSDQIEITYEIVQAAYNRLNNDEKMEASSKLRALGKAPDSNKLYSTLLKEYLSFQPADIEAA